MNKRFRAFYKPDFDTIDGPLEFKQVDMDDKVLFSHEFEEEGFMHSIDYDFYLPFVDPNWVVQQWTNMIDKNGKLIFEGDIVSVIEPSNLFEVKFGKVNRDVLSHGEVGKIWPIEINGFYFEDIKTKLPCFSIYHNELGVHDLTQTAVVGNIFQGHEE